MFDCVLPTRIARTGTAVTHNGAFGLKGASYKTDFGPIEEGEQIADFNGLEFRRCEAPDKARTWPKSNSKPRD